jgi:hypothetical protein
VLWVWFVSFKGAKNFETHTISLQESWLFHDKKGFEGTIVFG